VTDTEREVRAMMHRQAERVNERPIATASLISRVRRRRIATATIASLAVIAIVWGAMAVLPHLRPDLDVAPPDNRGRETVLLLPLCGAPAGGTPACPTSTPAGHYRSALWGLSTEWFFDFMLPSGWSVRPLQSGSGLDLMDDDAGVGVSVVGYPHPVEEPGRSPMPPKRLARWVSQHPSFTTSPVTRTIVDGRTAWQIDVRVRPDAETTTSCRIDDRCISLFRPYLQSFPTVTVAPVAGTEGRLTFFTGERGVATVLWVWNAMDANGGLKRALAEVRPVLDTLQIGRQHEVKGP
jgi:hypothetical protein